tara:strand:+ start:58896 stop:59300 length:405 start_codon:yes stop_codon:yes gene_type:complete
MSSWEDNLPSEKGILCWAWMGGKNPKNRIEIITHKEGGTFCYVGGYVYHATPAAVYTELQYQALESEVKKKMQQVHERKCIELQLRHDERLKMITNDIKGLIVTDIYDDNMDIVNQIVRHCIKAVEAARGGQWQ